MDQLKEFLQQAAKHRFWIAVGIAALLPVIATFAGTGGIREEEKKKADEIKGAYSGAKDFVGKPIENAQWTKDVNDRTEVVKSDVNKSHVLLWEKQAPILDWPKVVSKEMMEWGPAVPKDVDPVRINEVKLAYIQAYPDYVHDQVYESFNPFDFKTGKGIVAAPPEKVLLRPFVFHEEDLPTLTQIWTAQRKLWIQRTLLDVVAKVNAKAKAKDWDGAPVKQIISLTVASAEAIDQKTNAQGQATLEPPPPVQGETDPNAEAAKADAAAGTGGGSAGSAAAGSAAAGGAAGFGGGGAGAGIDGSQDPIEFLKSPNPEQYYEVPISMDLLVEQDHMNDVLVEFRNSPMSIRVLDFEWTKPLKPVQKPKKGEDPGAMAGMGMGRGMGLGMGSGLMGDEMTGASGGNMMSLGSGYGDSSKGYLSSMRNGSRGAMMGGRGLGAGKGSTGREGGKDVKKENIEKLSKKGKKSASKDADKEESKSDEEESDPLNNPYFNVVHVTIKGTARFYQAPPKPETPEAASPGASPAPADAASATEPAKDAAAPADAAKADQPKGDQPKAEPAKADDAAKGEPAKDAPKDEAAKGVPAKDAPKDEPKADSAKGEPAKDQPPGDAPKTDAPQGEAPKGDAPPAGDAKPKA